MWINNPPFVIGPHFSPTAPVTEDFLKEDPIFRMLKTDWVSVSEEQLLLSTLRLLEEKTS